MFEIVVQMKHAKNPPSTPIIFSLAPCAEIYVEGELNTTGRRFMIRKNENHKNERRSKTAAAN